ncbi:hypothetical protein ACF1AL_14720 [Streptomyces sp. NPDC014801]|uniref:hypothetical protein n=1 Tax=Streptomyces sp. NPDC014801 TaxID=3364916 RepID=UPI0036FA97D3
MTESQAAPANCDHHYETHILGGHPITVRVCLFCRTPDWADLYGEAVQLYRWGRDDELAGRPPREKLSAYDMPRSALTEAANARQSAPQATDGLPEGRGGERAGEGREGLRVRPGQIYRSLGDPYPYTEPRRIKVVGEPITTLGRYGFGKVDVVTLTDTGREIRRRAIELTQLHPTATTSDGKPRRTGYALEAPAHNAGPSVAECAAQDRVWPLQKEGE